MAHWMGWGGVGVGGWGERSTCLVSGADRAQERRRRATSRRLRPPRLVAPPLVGQLAREPRERRRAALPGRALVEEYWTADVDGFLEGKLVTDGKLFL